MTNNVQPIFTADSVTTDALMIFETIVAFDDSIELSGRKWVSRFPTSNDTEDLVSPFKENVTSFINALQNAGANVVINATLRPKKRAYLMHWAFKIAKKKHDPRQVPEMKGVNIEWVHKDQLGNYSKEKSVQAAKDMVNAYNIAYQPALSSNHIKGKAIDMTITWHDTLSIVNASNQISTIRTFPRTGANIELHAVGASYGVHKL